MAVPKHSQGRLSLAPQPLVVVGLNLAHMKLHITRGHVQIIPKQVTDFGAGISENTLVASDQRRDLQGLEMATSRLARNCF